MSPLYMVGGGGGGGREDTSSSIVSGSSSSSSSNGFVILSPSRSGLSSPSSWMVSCCLSCEKMLVNSSGMAGRLLSLMELLGAGGGGGREDPSKFSKLITMFGLLRLTGSSSGSVSLLSSDFILSKLSLVSIVSLSVLSSSSMMISLEAGLALAVMSFLRLPRLRVLMPGLASVSCWTWRLLARRAVS